MSDETSMQPTVHPVTIYGEPVLHRRSDPVADFGPQLQRLVADMFATMDAAHGVGLAAPQIGVGLRVFTYEMDNEDGVAARGVVVNPVVTTSGRPNGDPDPVDDVEGCLSVPGESYPLVRPLKAHVIGQDATGARIEFDATGWFARCMQHEYDHLNGTLYVDRLEGRPARKAKRMLRANGWNVPGLTWLPGVDPDPFGHDDPDSSDGDDPQGGVLHDDAGHDDALHVGEAAGQAERAPAHAHGPDCRH